MVIVYGFKMIGVCNLFENKVRELSLNRFEGPLDSSVTTKSLSSLSVPLLIAIFSILEFANAFKYFMS